MLSAYRPNTSTFRAAIVKTPQLRDAILQESTVEFSIKASALDKLKSPVLVIAVRNGKELSAAGQALDAAANGHISAVIKLGDLSAKAGSTVVLHKVAGVAAERIVLVSLGDSEKEYRAAYGAAARIVDGFAVKEAVFAIDQLPEGKTLEWSVEEAACAVVDASYRFDQTKSKKDTRQALAKATFVVVKGGEKAAEAAAARGQALGTAVNYAKDLGNLAPNYCTPTYLAGRAQEIAKQFGMKVEILERPALEKLGMGSFISVAKGSTEAMKLIVLKHEGGKKGDKPVVLVGKAITFDSGGISLKPGEGMDEMKYDMMGGGSVIATMHAVGELKLPLNVIAIVPACENMPAGNASKPGDIVTTMNGLTVEILNTDAEGRLILCDALTYAERFTPAAVVDVATLTGACVIALGHITTGLYANKDALAQELMAASATSGDRAWHMPLFEEYHEGLKSNFADLANVGGRPGGSITAACFLSRFTEKYDWAHLDVAGTAWKSGAQKGATGRPVPLLTRFLQARAALASVAVSAKPAAKASAKPAAKSEAKPAAKAASKPAAKPAAKASKAAKK
ncbi:leucyl aminopeptidase [Burkholderiaceae bacterium DAT-1]|nr:leucyl aminopeptidase [Burkholderiaceae bacterium DAT-1]